MSRLTSNSLGHFRIEEFDGDIFILKRDANGSRYREAFSGFRTEDDAVQFLDGLDAAERARKMDQPAVREIASAYREEGRFEGGYVIVYDWKPCGWALSVDEPNGWLAGCLAVPEHANGPIYVAEGGDYASGAERFVRLESGVPA